MAQPVLVKPRPTEHNPQKPFKPSKASASPALPPISSFSFASILQSADTPDFHNAIYCIAEICAKNRMSLADEYGAHLPPLGEITATTSAVNRTRTLRPNMRRALTSVPEASSGSSEGSRKSLRQRSIIVSGVRRAETSTTARQIRIGSIGRNVSVESSTAVSVVAHVGGAKLGVPNMAENSGTDVFEGTSDSPAIASLQQLLVAPGSASTR